MNFSIRNRRIVGTLPVPVIWGMLIYPLAALGVCALSGRLWLPGILLLISAGVLYFFYFGTVSIVLGEVNLRRYWFQRVPRARIRRVLLACEVVTDLALKSYTGYLLIDDGSLFRLHMTAWPYQRRRPDSRPMRNITEVAAWAGVPLEIIDDPGFSSEAE